MAAADLPDVLQAPGLDRAAHPVRHHQGHRDPGPAPPARRAPTTHAAPADDLDRPRTDRRPHPTAPGSPPPRPARHPGNHPALAPPARRPPLDHPAEPTWPPCHRRWPARPDRAPGHREPDLGVPADPRRARGTRLSDRRLHRLDDPAQRRHRPLAPTGRTTVDPVPARAGRTRSWPATCSISTPSPCTGCMRSSSSSTPPGAYTSSASPRIPPAPG